MQILPVNNVYTKPQVQPSFGERDDWGGGRAFDPWVKEKMELEDKYIKKSADLLSDYHNDFVDWWIRTIGKLPPPHKSIFLLIFH